mgnify:CR=1 FL=1
MIESGFRNATRGRRDFLTREEFSDVLFEVNAHAYAYDRARAGAGALGL